VVVAGPRRDERSRRRVEGFLSRQPHARVVTAGGWYVEDAARVAPVVSAARPDGVFCVNDRLAEALLSHHRARGTTPPAIVGHDNAPVAESLHLTTIETPWDEMTDAAVSIIRARLAGHSGPARHIILAQRPVYRLTA
jgi:DNA-binding LacI/PurR family transcriptional regulator